MEDLLTKLKIYGIFRFIIYALHEVYLKVWMQSVMGSYSQGGEDIVVDRILGNKKKGFYVDIGANDPTRFNNTRRFYLKGWRGINIEPDPQCFQKIIIERQGDINLNIGIGKMNSKMTFYKFIPNTLSTFSQAVMRRYKKLGYKLVSEFEVPVRKLSSALKEYARERKIDFISIDTEGNDMDVLKGNDWKKFRPQIVCIEVEKGKKATPSYLRRMGYKEILNNGLNRIFVEGKD